jgi:hypothetical protein
MATSVHLQFHQLDDLVRRIPVVLLEVSELDGRKMPPEVPDFFDALYGEDFVSVAIAVWEVPHRQWLVERLAPARPEGVTHAGGLYLFLGGRATRYHLGYQVAVGVELFALETGGEHESALRAEEILHHFAPVVHDFFVQRPPRPRAPASPAARATPDIMSFDEACRLLGVSGDEPLDEIERITRKKLVLNHPDRVANLDPELGRLANARFRAMGAAFDIIRRRRGA